MNAPPPYIPQIRLYQDWLARERGLTFDSYDALWRCRDGPGSLLAKHLGLFRGVLPHVAQRCFGGKPHARRGVVPPARR